MKINIKALLVSLIISSFLALAMHLEVLPQGGKFSPKFQKFNDLSGPIWFVAIFTLIFYGLYLVTQRENRNKINLICPSCETPLTCDKKNEGSNELNCPKCDTPMVPLEGFYDKDKN